MSQVCEELGVTAPLGFSMNPRLQRETQALLEQAVEQHAATGQKQRRLASFPSQADSRPEPRLVIVKCEARSVGTNRRAIGTNRPGAAVLPQATDDEDAARGESANRSKELKVGLPADRLSDSRFLANFVRLFLHAAARNLLVRLRRTIARPLPPVAAITPDPLPAAALPPRIKRRRFHRRRRQDPLGEGHACTWPSQRIKVAVEIVVSTRRVLVRMPTHWPHLSQLFRIGRAVSLAGSG